MLDRILPGGIHQSQTPDPLPCLAEAGSSRLKIGIDRFAFCSASRKRLDAMVGRCPTNPMITATVS
jgi:hypothetical protein